MFSLAKTIQSIIDANQITVSHKVKQVLKLCTVTSVEKRLSAEDALSKLSESTKRAYLYFLFIPLIAFATYFILQQNSKPTNSTQLAEIDTLIITQAIEEPLPQTKTEGQTPDYIQNDTFLAALEKEYSKEEFYKTMDSIQQEAKQVLFEVEHKNQDSLFCINAGNEMWRIYKEENAKRTIKKWKKLTLRNYIKDSLFEEFVTYSNKWQKGGATDRYYSDFWSGEINKIVDSTDIDIYGEIVWNKK